MITNSYCKKCDTKWFSLIQAKTGKKPRQCPFCHNYYWWEPRKRARNKKK